MNTQSLPEAYFEILSTGVRVTSAHFNEPNFIPFDIRGKCPRCKSTEASIDFIITPQGLTLTSNRIKGSRFLTFDTPYPALPEHCVFKVYSKGTKFDIHYENIEQQQKPPFPVKDRADAYGPLTEFIENFFNILQFYSTANIPSEHLAKEVKGRAGEDFVDLFFPLLQMFSQFSDTPTTEVPNIDQNKEHLKPTQQDIDLYNKNLEILTQKTEVSDPQQWSQSVHSLMALISAAAAYIHRSLDEPHPQGPPLEEVPLQSPPPYQPVEELQASFPPKYESMPTIEEFNEFYQSMDAATAGLS